MKPLRQDTCETAPNVIIAVRGPFHIVRNDGSNATPKALKQRALLGLLALSPGHRRTREWLMAILWPEMDLGAAQVNLRRALSDIRKSFGPARGLLGSNRIEVWLAKGTHIDFKETLQGQAALLEATDVSEKPYEDWILSQRAADKTTSATVTDTATPLEAPGLTAQQSMIVLHLKRRAETNEFMAFCEKLLVDTLCRRLEAEGVDHIYISDQPNIEAPIRATTILHIELTSLHTAHEWHVHLRALADAEKRFLWSGHLQQAAETGPLLDGFFIEGFVSRSLSQIFQRYRSFKVARHSPLIMIHKASSQLYFQSLDGVAEAEATLSAFSSGDIKSLALAWRGFARLVTFLEHGGSRRDLIDDAKQLMDEALRYGASNPMVTSLASRVALDLEGDLGRARHFAQASLLSDAKNPYGLLANARVALMDQKPSDALVLAQNARLAAEGLPHAFAWDMEVCLAAMGSGDLKAAQDAAQKAYWHNPTHRAALRYLIALSSLVGEHDQAARAVERMRKLEPEFAPRDLIKDSYPVLSLRKTGYAEALRPILAAEGWA